MINNLIKNIGRCGMLRQRIKSDCGRLLFVKNNMMRFSEVMASSNVINEGNNDGFKEEPLTLENQQYTERAYTPSEMSNQLLTELSHTKQSPELILHQLSLYYHKLLPFDYDYFTESLRRLIHYQQKLSMEEILMLFDLAIEYKIDSLVLERQFMNEIYCRVYLGMKKELLEYDNKMQEQIDVTYKALESMSKDHFEIIDEKFKELLEEEENEGEKDQDEQENNENDEGENKTQQKLSAPKQKLKNKPIYNAGLRKNKSKKISPEILNRITKIFVNFNSKNIEFNKLLLEIHTTRMDENALIEKKVGEEEELITADNLLLYTRLTVNLLQLYMTEYQSTLATSKNKENKYTHRSVKNIYKLQHFYYYEVAKMIEEKLLLSTATNEQLLEFVNVLSTFPIKRRSFRKAVGDAMIQEFKKRELEVEEMMKFFELSRYDNKLLEHFEKKINQGKQLPQGQESEKLENTTTNNQKETTHTILTSDVIIDSESPETDQPSLFKMPLSLFKKVTKKKSKPKNKKPEENEVEIDLTQPDEEINTEINSESINNGEVKRENIQ